MTYEYEWTGDHSDIPGLGLTVRRGDRVTLQAPFEHPELKEIPQRKAAEKSRPSKADTPQPTEAETPDNTTE